MIFEVTVDARQDIADAYSWYESQQAGLGDLFLLQFREIRKALFLKPNGYRSYHQYREVPFKQFPYLALYEVCGDKIVVFGVFHTSQNPLKKDRS